MALATIALDGPWSRLHRAESDLLASLLTTAEMEAVNRRLGLPPAGAARWVPPSAGSLGGRFTRPLGPGSLYLGGDLATCVQEVAHHHARHCAASLGTPPGTRAVFRHLQFQLHGTLANSVRDRAGGLHRPEDYGPSWVFGDRTRRAGLDGVHYRSVRHPGGRCCAVYVDRAASFLRVDFGAVILEWDGTRSQRTG